MDSTTQPEPEKSMDSELSGGVTPTVAVADPPPTHAHARGRWEQVRRQARGSGMNRRQAIARANAVVAEEFPEFAADYPEPIEPEPIPEEAEALGPPAADTGVTGLDQLPADWPSLPANASLQAEIAWVAANRLLVTVGPDTVDLSRSLSPAPSHAAIGWLETSIRAYSKYCDIAAKATAQQEQGAEATRRERVACEEIEALLEAVQLD